MNEAQPAQEQPQQAQPDPNKDLFDLEELNTHLEAIEYLTSRLIELKDEDAKAAVGGQLNEAYRLFYCKLNSKFRALHKHITPALKPEYELITSRTKEIDNYNLRAKDSAEEAYTYISNLIKEIQNPINHYRGGK